VDSTEFEGQTAVVTGGAQGIGKAICRRLMDGGARIAIWDLDASLAETTARELCADGDAVAFFVDVTELASVEAALTATKERFGSVQILVNNAGISGPNATTWDYAPEDWDKVMALNLTGPFYCCRSIAPHMIEGGYGRIVSIASVAGKEGNPGAPAYSASKAGLIGLTKSLGKELAGHDISVNCVTPAAAKTAIFNQMSEEHIAFMLSKIPRNRFALVEEIADIVAFAASRRCSFTTGSVFDVSGGRATY
jgi:3-oxoacyl-[acyl-carrier protein] reductase